MHQGLVKHWMDDFTSGYYISSLGKQVLEEHNKAQEVANEHAKYNECMCRDEKGNTGIIEKVFKARNSDLYKAKVLMDIGSDRYYFVDDLRIW